MSDSTRLPVCIYATKERARVAESKARDEIAAVLKKHGALGAIVIIGMAHREDAEVRMNVGIEASGSAEHVDLMAADILRPGLFEVESVRPEVQ